MKKLVVGFSGATGVIYGVRLLEVLQGITDIQTHLIISDAAKRTIRLETAYTVDQVERLAHERYDFNDIGAAIASGSYPTSGMVVVPCAVKTLSGIAHSYSDNLILRAADVTLKERRKLVLLFRETPLHLGHLRLMVQATEMGAIIMPPLPAFYHRPQTIDDIINQTVNRVLDVLNLDLEPDLFRRWQGSAH
ncbi:MAG: UbiX family flavin prenyltransferase [Anaerolineae bacterium]|nr:UbiX family flavin prenyltransferase [Anaerolineae bacterium]